MPATDATAARPRKKPGPKTPAGWQERYLERLREHGGFTLAARESGIERSTAMRARDADPEFARRCQEALDDLCDQLEHDLVRIGRDKNNPVAVIMLLKKYRPEFIERHQVMQLNASVSFEAQDANEARAFLRQCLSSASPETLALIEHTPEHEGTQPGS